MRVAAPVTDAELELLRWIVARPSPGPVRETPERIRLMRLGLIESFRPLSMNKSGGVYYQATAAGRVVLGACVDG